MQEFITRTRFGGIITVLLCLLPILGALLCLFKDRKVRYAGVLTVTTFGIGLISLCVFLELSGLEMPDWLVGNGIRNRRGSILLLLWAWCSYKIADWLYCRYLH